MSKITSPDLMKINNKRTILEIIYKQKNIYRAQIAEMTNMSNQTITNLVKELIDEGMVQEVILEKKSKGRNPIALSINFEGYYAIGAEISVKKISVGLYNACGNLIRKEEQPLCCNPLEQLKSIVNDIVKDMDTNKVLGMAVSIEGIVDEINGLVIKSRDIGLDGVNLLSELEYLGIPVQIRNDVNMLAETNAHRERFKNYMVIKLDRGIGAALILNGEILRSQNNIAGEFGHVTVFSNPEPKLCKCGKRGCLTTEASLTVIEQNMNMDIHEIYEKYSLKDEYVTSTLKKIIGYIAEPLSNLITVLDLNTVILTGTILNIFGDDFRSELDRNIRGKLNSWASYSGLDVLEDYDMTQCCSKCVVEHYFVIS